MEKSVHELNQDELEELRGNYFVQLQNTDSDVLDDITSSDDIPMGDVILHYEGTSFYNDDFSVTFKIKQYE
jgi:hypothetical protein